MKKFYRILVYIKPELPYAGLNVLFNLLTIVFSLFSFALLIPFLNLLFGIEDLVTVKPEFAMNTKAFLNYLNYQISNVIVTNGKVTALVYICVVLIIAFFLRNLARFFSMYFMANVRIGAIKGMRNAIYNKLLILPLSFFSKNKKGDIIARVTTDVQEVEFSIMNSLEMIIRDPVTILAYVAFMLSMSPRLTLFVLLILPVTGFLIGQIGKSLRKQSKIGQNKFAGLLSNIEETISGLRIIKAFNAIDYSKNKFKGQNEDFSRLLIWIYRRRDLSSPMSFYLLLSSSLFYGLVEEWCCQTILPSRRRILLLTSLFSHRLSHLQRLLHRDFIASKKGSPPPSVFLKCWMQKKLLLKNQMPFP